MKKQTILVTGANRGLGLVVCKDLLQKGHQVIATSRKAAQKAGLLDQLSGLGEITYVQLDVQSEEEVARCYEEVKRQFGKLDCLINNAGIIDRNTVQETSTEELLHVFRTNVMGPFMLCKQFIPLLTKSDQAKIINVTSQMGSLTNSGPTHASYRLSKTALNSLTRLLHHELEAQNIQVYSVCPGWVHTDMGGSGAPRSPEQGAYSILFPFYQETPSGSYLQDGKELAW